MYGKNTDGDHYESYGKKGQYKSSSDFHGSKDVGKEENLYPEAQSQRLNAKKYPRGDYPQYKNNTNQNTSSFNREETEEYKDNYNENDGGWNKEKGVIKGNDRGKYKSKELQDHHKVNNTKKIENTKDKDSYSWLGDDDEGEDDGHESHKNTEKDPRGRDSKYTGNKSYQNDKKYIQTGQNYENNNNNESTTYLSNKRDIYDGYAYNSNINIPSPKIFYQLKADENEGKDDFYPQQNGYSYGNEVKGKQNGEINGDKYYSNQNKDRSYRQDKYPSKFTESNSNYYSSNNKDYNHVQPSYEAGRGGKHHTTSDRHKPYSKEYTSNQAYGEKYGNSQVGSKKQGGSQTSEYKKKSRHKESDDLFIPAIHKTDKLLESNDNSNINDNTINSIKNDIKEIGILKDMSHHNYKESKEVISSNTMDNIKSNDGNTRKQLSSSTTKPSQSNNADANYNTDMNNSSSERVNNVVVENIQSNVAVTPLLNNLMQPGGSNVFQPYNMNPQMYMNPQQYYNVAYMPFPTQQQPPYAQTGSNNSQVLTQPLPYAYMPGVPQFNNMQPYYSNMNMPPHATSNGPATQIPIGYYMVPMANPAFTPHINNNNNNTQ